MSPNPLVPTEYNFAEFNDDVVLYAWTRNNVSQAASSILYMNFQTKKQM